MKFDYLSMTVYMTSQVNMTVFPVHSNKPIVLHLIRKATEEHPGWVLGRKALQKSLYFFNLKQDCFSFRWADFGPISGEIQQIAHDLEAAERIKIEPVKTKKPGAVIKSMRYISKDPALEISTDLSDALEETLKFAAGRTSRELELLASVHFWATRCPGRDIAEYVKHKLDELKPEAGFAQEDVEKSIRQLQEHKILRDAATPL